MATLNLINIGTVPDDGTGDPIRDAYNKSNTNDTALNNQANLSTNNIANMKMWSESKAGSGNQIFTIPNGGFLDSTYEYTFNAYDSNGFEVAGIRRVSKNATTITLNLPQPCTITINARKL